MLIKTFYHFLDSTLGVEISSEKRGYHKKRGGVLEFFLPGMGQMTYLGKEVLPGRPGVWETIQIN